MLPCSSKSTLRLSKHQGSPAHSDHSLQKGKGFMRVLGVAGLGCHWGGGKGGPRSAWMRACCKNLRESGEVAEIDISENHSVGNQLGIFSYCTCMYI